VSERTGKICMKSKPEVGVGAGGEASAMGAAERTESMQKISMSPVLALHDRKFAPAAPEDTTIFVSGDR
jgi:hypothetical protein